MAVTNSYTPKAFTADGAKYSGTISLRMPTYVERITLMREVDACGEDNLLRLITMAKAIPAYFVGADITRLDDSQKFTTWSDLESESGLADVISEATVKILGEARVGAKTS